MSIGMVGRDDLVFFRLTKPKDKLAKKKVEQTCSLRYFQQRKKDSPKRKFL